MLILSRQYFLLDRKTPGDGGAPHVDALLRSTLPEDKPYQDKMKILLRGNDVRNTRKHAAHAVASSTQRGEVTFDADHRPSPLPFSALVFFV